ncbi:MAG: tetratricopeptide repeat protein [Leptospirales bacterium]
MDKDLKNLVPQIQRALEDREWLKAFHRATSILDRHPDHEIGRYLLIDSLVLGGRYDIALERVRSFLTDMPGNHRLQLYLLHLLVYHRTFEEAETLGKALLRESLTSLEKRDVLLHTAFALHGTGELRRAVRMLNELLDEDPLNTDALETLGKIYFEQGHFEEAERYFLELTEMDPAHPRVHQLLGLLYSEQGKWDEAIMEWEEAMEIAPSDEVLRELGWTLNMAGEKEAAVTMLEEALDLNPLNLQARIDLGSVLMDQEKFERAIKEWEIAKNQDPDNSMIRLYLENAQKAVAGTPNNQNMVRPGDSGGTRKKTN